MKRTTLFILLHILCLFPTLAQSSSTVRQFSVRDGLPANAITSVKQDTRGLIWIATWNGLCCFDGHHFTTFRGEPWGNENALSSYRISAIEPNGEGNIWVRTYDAGLYLFDAHECRFINISLLLQQKFGERLLVRNIYAIEGHTWVTTQEDERVIRLSNSHSTDLDSMAITDGKQFWKDEFPKHNPVDMRPVSEDARQYVKDYGINKYFIDRQGNLWLPSPHHMGLELINFNKYEIGLLPVMPRVQTRSVLCRRDGTVWVGTFDGHIAVFNEQRQQLGWVNRQGRVTQEQEVVTPMIYALMEDQQGQVWIGSKMDGLYVATPQGMKHYRHSDSDPYSLSHDAIYAIDQDEKGQIWIATYGGGINLLKDGKFLHRGNDLKYYPKENFEKVRRITHDSRGNMLASTTTGLLTFSSQTTNPKQLRFHTSHHYPNDTTSLRANDVAQVLVTRSGTAYVITMGGGIQRITSPNLQQDQLKLENVPVMNQGEGSALSMVEDRLGDIWITRESEVNHYMVRQDMIEQYGPNSMDREVDLTEAQAVVHPDGSIWAGGMGHVLTFHPENMGKSIFRPQIVFTEAQYQGEQTVQHLLSRGQLNIDRRDRRSLTIRFSALDYEDDYLMKYAYRLTKGKSAKNSQDGDDDKHWNYIGHHGNISFNQLAPGYYALTVKSTNADGVWVDNEATIMLYVKPMFWERLWVRLLALLLVIGLSTWAVIRYLHYRQEQREREQRLENIMAQYRELQKNQSAERLSSATPTTIMPPASYTLSEPEIKNPDEEMMNQLMAFIEQHMDDESLHIEDMADAVGLGRTVFYGKIKNLVGVSPSDFLKQVRMQRAEQLLRKSRMTISEVAYAVGFTDPKYFTKCFKKQTGKTPSELRSAE